VAWVGYTEDQAKKEGRKVEAAKFPWAASGRAIANGCDYGFTKLIFDAETHRVIGGAIVGPNAGDMIGEVCLAIEMGCDSVDIGKTIHPHPTLGETVGMAAEVAHGTCTDVPAPRELAGTVMKEAIARSGVDPQQINYVTVGNTMPTDSRYAYVARVASIQAGLSMDSVAMRSTVCAPPACRVS
jgi:pyruvate/2-oxoglutarate dehydrogenase complex dihydrolipoamide acyltransferase (E2) component